MHSQQQDYILDVHCAGICVVFPGVYIWNDSLDSTEYSHIKLLFKDNECGEARWGKCRKNIGNKSYLIAWAPHGPSCAKTGFGEAWGQKFVSESSEEPPVGDSYNPLGHLAKPDLLKQLCQIHAFWKETNPGSHQGNWDLNQHVINSTARMLAKSQKSDHPGFPEPGIKMEFNCRPLPPPRSS